MSSISLSGYGLLIIIFIVICFGIYIFCCKKNLRIVFDRIISRGKFGSSITLVFVFIAIIYLVLCLIINFTGLFSNDLVQFDNDPKPVMIKNSPDSTNRFTITHQKFPTLQQRDELISHIQKTCSIPNYCLNETIHPKDKTVSYNLTIVSNNRDSISSSLKEKIDSVSDRQQKPSLFWSVYYHIIDPGNQHMASTPLARFFAVLLSIFGTVLLGGLFISILTNIFDNRRERWKNGMLRYNRFFKNYYVILGCNEMASNIINQIFEAARQKNRQEHPKRFMLINFISTYFGYKEEILPYIVILTSSDIEHQRDTLFSQLELHEQKRIVFYSGNRGSKEDIDSLKIHRATEVYVLGESIDKDRCGQPSVYGEPHHDTLNMTSVKLIAENLRLISTQAESRELNRKSFLNKIFTVLTHCYNTLLKHVKNIKNILTEKFPGSIKSPQVSSFVQRLRTRIILTIVQPDDDESVNTDFDEDYAQPDSIPAKTKDKPKAESVIKPAEKSKDKNTHKKAQPEKRKLVCHILFEYQTTFSVFQTCDITNVIKEFIDFRPFNYYESWAQKVFVDCKAIIPEKDGQKSSLIYYTPLDGHEGIGNTEQDSKKFVHLIIVGMSKMGIAMALEAAHICHFPNFKENGPHTRTRITFIDSRAGLELDFFKGRFKDMFEVARWRFFKADDYLVPGLFPDVDKNIYTGSSRNESDFGIWRDPLNDTASKSPYKHLAITDNGNKESFIDIEWEFVEGSLESPAVQQYLKLAAENNDAKLTVAICLPRAHQAIAAGIYMPREVYEHNTEILVYQRESAEILKTIINQSGNSTSLHKNIKPFGMLECSYDIANDNDILLQAQMVNYVYREPHDYMFNDNDYTVKMKYYNDNENSVEGKWSNIYNVNSIPTKLRSFSLYDSIYCVKSHSDLDKILEDKVIDDLSVIEHNRWNVEKLLMGFRPLTKKESEELKEDLKQIPDAGSVTTISGRNAFKGSKWKNAADNSKSRPKKAHIDLRPVSMLQEIDPGVKEYDQVITKAIPYIVHIARSKRIKQ